MRLNDKCSGLFSVEYGLRQGSELAPLLLNIVFAAVIQVALVRFEADEDNMDALVSPKRDRVRRG